MISITPEKFSIKNRSFQFPIGIKSLTDLLGPATYHKKWSAMGNHVYTWNELGIAAFSKNNDAFESVCFFLKIGERYKYTPANSCSCEIRIEERDISQFWPGSILDKGFNYGNYQLFFDSGDNEDEIMLFEVSQKTPEKVKDPSICLPAKICGPRIEFSDFNFKLAVMQVLMYEKELLKPKFDLYRFVANYPERDIDVEDEGYAFIPEVTRYFEEYEIPLELAEKVTEIYQDGGDDIYGQLLRFWNGEDETFNIKSFADAKQFPHLKKMTLFYYDDPAVLQPLKAMGIETDLQ